MKILNFIKFQDEVRHKNDGCFKALRVNLDDPNSTQENSFPMNENDMKNSTKNDNGLKAQPGLASISMFNNSRKVF